MSSPSRSYRCTSANVWMHPHPGGARWGARGFTGEVSWFFLFRLSWSLIELVISVAGRQSIWSTRSQSKARSRVAHITGHSKALHEEAVHAVLRTQTVRCYYNFKCGLCPSARAWTKHLSPPTPSGYVIVVTYYPANIYMCVAVTYIYLRASRSCPACQDTAAVRGSSCIRSWLDGAASGRLELERICNRFFRDFQKKLSPTGSTVAPRLISDWTQSVKTLILRSIILMEPTLVGNAHMDCCVQLYNHRSPFGSRKLAWGLPWWGFTIGSEKILFLTRNGIFSDNMG